MEHEGLLCASLRTVCFVILTSRSPAVSWVTSTWVEARLTGACRREARLTGACRREKARVAGFEQILNKGGTLPRPLLAPNLRSTTQIPTHNVPKPQRSHFSQRRDPAQFHPQLAQLRISWCNSVGSPTDHCLPGLPCSQGQVRRAARMQPLHQPRHRL